MHSRVIKIKEVSKNNFSISLCETSSGNYFVLTVKNGKEFSEAMKDLNTALFVFDTKLKELEGH